MTHVPRMRFALTAASMLAAAGAVFWCCSWSAADDTAAKNPTGKTPDKTGVAATGESSKDAPKESDDQATVNYIGELIRKGWTDNGVSPSGLAMEGEWLRRVYLDVLGRIPTLKEAKEFSSDRSGEKKRKLVQKLLYHDDYVEEYARN